MTKTDLIHDLSRPAYAKGPIDVASTTDDREQQQTPRSEDEEQRHEPKIGGNTPESRLPQDECDRLPAPPPLSSTPPEAQRPPSSPLTTGRQSGEYLTRRQAAAYVNGELGRPMSFSTASKLAALGEFAKPALWWGNRPLYTRDSLRTWAEARAD